ncbi:MAG: hypothetical protein WCK96_02835 [Methylococcales bacterium]
MGKSILSLPIFLLLGCAGTPHAPPTFTGEYKPINQPNESVNALHASQTIQPPLTKPSSAKKPTSTLIKKQHSALTVMQPKLAVMPPAHSGITMQSLQPPLIPVMVNSPAKHPWHTRECH